MRCGHHCLGDLQRFSNNYACDVGPYSMSTKNIYVDNLTNETSEDLLYNEKKALGVPVNNKLRAGTVPVNNKLHGGRVPVNNKLSTSTVPV